MLTTKILCDVVHHNSKSEKKNELFILFLFTFAHIMKKKEKKWKQQMCIHKREKKATMLDQKPIYKINEYHIKMAWEKKKYKRQVNEK